MEYGEDLRYILHDINNNLMMVNTNLLKIQTQNPNEYQKLKHYTKKITTSIHNISLLVDKKFCVRTEQIQLKTFLDELDRVIDENKLVYPNVVTNHEIIGADTSQYQLTFSPYLLEQLVLNIFSNSMKSQSQNILVATRISAGHLDMTFLDDGQGYESPSFGVHGIGQKIITRNVESMGGSCEFKQTPSGYKVKVSLKLLKF